MTTTDITPYTLDLPEADNPDPRVAVTLALDVSGSMTGAPITELQRGYDAFVAAVGTDELARKRAEISVVTFGGIVKVATEFVEAQHLQSLPFAATGGTPMAEAIDVSLDLLEARKTQYRTMGLDYYRPWLVVITDGCPTDMSRWSTATARARRTEADGGVSIFAVGVNGADMGRLGELSTRPPLMLDGINFTELFLWLSASLSSVSSSTPTSADPSAMVPLPPVTNWATA